MRTKIIYGLTLMTGLLLITSCNGLTDSMPTSTPDILLMDIYERTIWDFENIREELNDLALAAADTPAENLEPILRQMNALEEEIKGYEFPLDAAEAHSALYYFADIINQCYGIEYGEYLLTGEAKEEWIAAFSDYDRCDRVQVYEETFDLYLQELKETYVEK